MCCDTEGARTDRVPRRLPHAKVEHRGPSKKTRRTCCVDCQTHIDAEPQRFTRTKSLLADQAKSAGQGMLQALGRAIHAHPHTDLARLVATLGVS